MRSFETTAISLLLCLFITKADRISRSALRSGRSLQVENTGTRKQYEKRIPASSFVEKNGATVNDATNGLFWFNKGDWVTYELDLPEAGQYLLEVRISSPLGEGAFQVANRETNVVYASVNTVPVTTTWEEYTTLDVDLTLPKGLVPLTLQVVAEGWGLQWLSIAQDYATAASDPPSALNNSTSTAPPVNTTVNITRTNTARRGDLRGQPYRTMIASATYSEMQGMLVQDSIEGLQNLYWIDRGDHVTYQVRLPVSGVFLLKTRIASPEGIGAFQIRNKVSGEVYATVTELPSTGSFQTWETITTSVELPAGDISLEIRALSHGWNLLWIVLELQPEPLIDITSPVVLVNDAN
jgi:endoglucanase